MKTIDGLAVPGQTLAGYRIERPLGGGGMGAVHLALGPHGPVALKLLDLGGPDGPQLQRTFARELAIGQTLDHPGIVRIFDAGQVGGLAFVAMEYMAGGDLAQWRARHGGPPPVPWALEVIRRLADALAHAHDRFGIVHRDVKPANILLETRHRAVKLADFGLARLADQQRSRTGVFAGTPTFMSPEQMADGIADGRSDLYSLGAVLFELLAGRPPHEAGNLGALLREVCCTPAPDLGVLRPDLPAALTALVARLLDKQPRNRPSSARALADEVAALEAQLGLRAAGPCWP
ncbi:MAG: serine/threonine protein kinase [Rubrivivax sp.]|nr:serine/threonine protein kinase [Rubrivivax sp.]